MGWRMGLVGMGSGPDLYSNYGSVVGWPPRYRWGVFNSIKGRLRTLGRILSTGTCTGA